MAPEENVLQVEPTVAPEAAPAAEPAVPPTEAPAAEQPATPDYKALHEATLAELATLKTARQTEAERWAAEKTAEKARTEQVISSLRGQLKQRHNEVSAAEFAEMKKTLKAIADRTAKGEIEQLPGDIDRIEQESAQTRANDLFNSYQQKTNLTLERVQKKLNLKEVRDIVGIPEMAEAVNEYNAAFDRRDGAAMRAAAADMLTIADDLHVNAPAAPAPLTTTPAPVSTPTPAAPRAPAALNPTAVGAQKGTNKQAIVNKAGRGEPMTAEEHLIVRQALAEGIYPQ